MTGFEVVEDREDHFWFADLVSKLVDGVFGGCLNPNGGKLDKHFEAVKYFEACVVGQFFESIFNELWNFAKEEEFFQVIVLQSNHELFDELLLVLLDLFVNLLIEDGLNQKRICIFLSLEWILILIRRRQRKQPFTGNRVLLIFLLRYLLLMQDLQDDTDLGFYFITTLL